MEPGVLADRAAETCEVPDCPHFARIKLLMPDGGSLLTCLDHVEEVSTLSSSGLLSVQPIDVPSCQRPGCMALRSHRSTTPRLGQSLSVSNTSTISPGFHCPLDC